jgi:ATP-dependent protease ClpP protease subunit
MDKQSKENFINKNTVYIHGEFDIDIIEILPLIRKEIDNQKTLKNGKIIFSINSVGGYVYILISLLNLIDYAKKSGVIVETIVESMAYSCGSLLACSGSIGHRYIAEYAEHLCHFPRGSFYSATLEQLDRNAERLKRVMLNCKSIYKKYCKDTAQKGYIEKLFRSMKDDNFFIPAKECIKYGLADKIL